MEAIRTKDLLFLACVVPLAAVAAYVCLWRTDASRRADALARECASLVSAGDYPDERAALEHRLAEAKAELVAERQAPPPAEQVLADPADRLADRELAVIETFRAAGLAVVRSATCDRATARFAAVLQASGTRPQPACREYALEGPYPALVAALRTFERRKMAVIPDCVEMPRPGRWIVALWL